MLNEDFLKVVAIFGFFHKDEENYKIDYRKLQFFKIIFIV